MRGWAGRTPSPEERAAKEYRQAAGIYGETRQTVEHGGTMRDMEQLLGEFALSMIDLTRAHRRGDALGLFQKMEQVTLVNEEIRQRLVQAADDDLYKKAARRAVYGVSHAYLTLCNAMLTSRPYNEVQERAEEYRDALAYTIDFYDRLAALPRRDMNDRVGPVFRAWLGMARSKVELLHAVAALEEGKAVSTRFYQAATACLLRSAALGRALGRHCPPRVK